MTVLKYVETDCTDPWINLAAEEYMTFRAAEDEVILFLWQNANTVVIGRNQDPDRECRLRVMAEEGCRLARRISGGGAVYHDLGNLNFTFIAREDRFDTSRQTEVILQAVQDLGIRAEKNGRNDLTVSGKKFSGHAYFQSGPYRYHHGTLMADVDGEKLERYLHVSEGKLRSKGVRSVRSRVVNLKELQPNLTIDRLKESLRTAFGRVYGGPLTEVPLPSRQDPAMEELVRKYGSERWLYGRRIPFDAQWETRFGWGGVSVKLQGESGRIRDIQISSDALETEIFSELEQRLRGIPARRDAVEELKQDYEGRQDLTGQIAGDLLEWIGFRME